MIEQRTLADVIQQKLALGPANARGFCELKCAVCSDYQARGAFKFDADSTGYHCWNCSAKFKYEEGSGKLSKNARQVLAAFGIDRQDLLQLPSTMFVAAPKEENITAESLKKVKLFTPVVPLPDKSFPLGTEGSEDQQVDIIEYLYGRKVDPLAIGAHFSLDPRFLRRVIIPFYRDAKIIYWQARAIDDDVKPRYLNCYAARDAVIYGYDELFNWSTKPLFVTEGVFDAIVLKGVCLLGSTLNEAKLEVLKRCRRRVIFVMDQDKTGDALASAAMDNGWEITFLDRTGEDANKSVQLRGLPYTVFTLLKNATRDRIKLSMGHLNSRWQGTYR